MNDGGRGGSPGFLRFGLRRPEEVTRNCFSHYRSVQRERLLGLVLDAVLLQPRCGKRPGEWIRISVPHRHSPEEERLDGRPVTRLVGALKRWQADGMEEDDGRDQAGDGRGDLVLSQKPPADEQEDQRKNAGCLQDPADRDEEEEPCERLRRGDGGSNGDAVAEECRESRRARGGAPENPDSGESSVLRLVQLGEAEGARQKTGDLNLERAPIGWKRPEIDPLAVGDDLDSCLSAQEVENGAPARGLGGTRAEDQDPGAVAGGELDPQMGVARESRESRPGALDDQVEDPAGVRGLMDEIDDPELRGYARVRQVLRERGRSVPAIDGELSEGKRDDGERNEGRPECHVADSLRNARRPRD